MPGVASPAPVQIALYRYPRVIRRAGDDRARIVPGWTLHWLPVPLEGAVPGAGYNIYSNNGSGPINYGTPVATTHGLSYTTAPLTYPATWRWGVRAYNSFGEEKNLDCYVEIILDSGGNDISLEPSAPAGLRAFPLAAGAIRVEWSYPFTDRDSVPTGFYVYLGSGGGALLCPVAPIAAAGTVHGRTGRQRWRPGPYGPLVYASAAAVPGLRGAGRVRWRPAVGSPFGYGQPAATVLFASGSDGVFGVTIPGLTNGVTYTVGVRSYNSTATETNTATVTVTADSVGPLPVVDLVGIAI